jgi:hypothetical protein
MIVGPEGEPEHALMLAPNPRQGKLLGLGSDRHRHLVHPKSAVIPSVNDSAQS